MHDEGVAEEEFGHAEVLGGEGGVIAGAGGEEGGDFRGLDGGAEGIGRDGGGGEFEGGCGVGGKGEFEEGLVEAGEAGRAVFPDGEGESGEVAGGFVVFDVWFQVGIAGSVEGAGDEDGGELAGVGGFEGAEVLVEVAAAAAGVVEVFDEDVGGVGAAEDGEVGGVEGELALEERDWSGWAGGACELAEVGWGWGIGGWGGGGGAWRGCSVRDLVALGGGAEDLGKGEGGGGEGGGDGGGEEAVGSGISAAEDGSGGDEAGGVRREAPWAPCGAAAAPDHESDEPERGSDEGAGGEGEEALAGGGLEVLGEGWQREGDDAEVEGEGGEGDGDAGDLGPWSAEGLGTSAFCAAAGEAGDAAREFEPCDDRADGRGGRAGGDPDEGSGWGSGLHGVRCGLMGSGGRKKGRDLPWWGGSRPWIRRMQGNGSRSDHVAVERLPVVEVVEIDGILEGTGVLDIVFCEDRLAGGVVVDVARDGGIEFADGFRVEVAAFFLEDPDFEFRVGGFAVADEGEEFLAVDAEAVEDHLVVSLAAGWVIVVQSAGGAEAGLLPEAWEVEDAEGAGDAGGDDRNEFHGMKRGVACKGERDRSPWKSIQVGGGGVQVQDRGKMAWGFRFVSMGNVSCVGGWRATRQSRRWKSATCAWTTGSLWR